MAEIGSTDDKRRVARLPPDLARCVRDIVGFSTFGPCGDCPGQWGVSSCDYL